MRLTLPVRFALAILVAVILFRPAAAGAQCSAPIIDLANDTLCKGTGLVADTSSVNLGTANTFNWTFCVSDANQNPTPVALLTAATTGLGTLPQNVTWAEDAGQYYAFLPSNTNIIRLDFGNSPANTPVSTNLGNIGGAMGSNFAALRLVKHAGLWYGFGINSTTNQLVRYSFGASLTNAPTGAVVTGVGALTSAARNLYVVQDPVAGYQVIIANTTSTNLTVATLGSSPANAATTVNIPVGVAMAAITVVRECDGWVGFALQFNAAGSGNVYRIDFGTSISDGGTASLLTSVSPVAALNLSVMDIAGYKKVFVAAFNSSNLAELTFPTSFLTDAPVLKQIASPLGPVGYDLVWANDSIWGLGVNRSTANSFRFSYPYSCQASITRTTLASPPVVNYATPGTYRLHLRATNAAGRVYSQIDTVVVAPTFAAGFSTGCGDPAVQFTNNTLPGGIADAFHWDFADAGATSTLPSPLHSFSTSGPFMVELIATDTLFGCADTVTQQVQLLPNPAVAFNITTACIGQDLVLQNTSSINSGSITTYDWKFLTDAQQASNPAFPSFTRPFPSAQDSYAVRLIATSNLGCIDSLTQTVPLPKINTTITQNCGGDSVWVAANVYYPNASLTAYGWNMGDGTVYAGQDTLQHTYATTGQYLAYFYASSTNGCQDTVWYTQDVLLPGLSLGSDTLCPGSVVDLGGFSAMGLQDLTWDFCAPSFNSLPTAALVFTDTNSVLQTLGEFYTPVTDGVNHYLFQSNRQNIARYDFGASYTNTPAFTSLGNPGGLVAENFGSLSFVEQSGNWFAFRTDHTDGRLVRYAFGNSLTNTPTADEITIPGGGAYQPGSVSVVKEGAKTVLLIANRKATSLTRVVFTGVLSAAPASIAQISTGGVHFIDVELNKGPCGTWYGVGLGGGGTSTSGITNRLYSFEFRDSIEAIPTVTLLDTLPVSTQHISRFVGKGRYVTFAPGLSNNTLYVLETPANASLAAPGGIMAITGINFPHGIEYVEQGGAVYAFGTARSSANNELQRWQLATPCGPAAVIQGPAPQYTYPSGAQGARLVSLSATVAATGQQLEFLDTVYVRGAPLAGFVAPASCFGQPTQFEDTSAAAANAALVQWEWLFGDGGTSPQPSPTHLYPSTGSFDAQLVVTDIHGCTDTVLQTLNVNSTPTASFTVQALCADDAPVFTDASSVGSPDTLVYREWTFLGTGTVVYNPGLVFEANPDMLSGSAQVQLVVVSDQGCTDTLATAAPIPTISIAQDAYCAGLPIGFSALATYPADVPTAYSWEFSSGGTATGQAPAPVVLPAGTQNVLLVVTTQGGCTDSVQLALALAPRPVLAVAPIDTACVGQVLVLQDQSQTTVPIEQWRWVLNTQGNPQPDTLLGQNTLWNFASLAPVQIELHVAQQGGCTADTVFSIAPQEPPVLTVADSVLMTCAGQPITLGYTASGSAIAGQRWELDTLGGTLFSPLAQPTYNFPLPTLRQVRLLAWTSQNCVSRDTVRIMAQEVPQAAIQLAGPTQGEIPFTIQAANITTGPADGYVWRFAPGTELATDTDTTVSYTYDTPGTYVLWLQAENNGCVSADSVTLTVSLPIAPVWDVEVLGISSLSTNGPASVVLVPTLRNAGNQPIVNLGYRIMLSDGISLADTLRNLNLQPGQQTTLTLGPALSQNPHNPYAYACVTVSLPVGIQDATPWNNDTCATLQPTLEILALYPNPAAGDAATLEFVAPTGATATVRMIDAQGRLVYENASLVAVPGPNRWTLPLEALPSGVYSVELRVDGARVFRTLARP